MNNGSEIDRSNSAQPPGEDANQSTFAYRWYIVSILALVACVNYIDRYSLSVLLPEIKAELGLSDSQVGLLVGFAFFLMYATVGIPIARLADRGRRNVIIGVSLAVWSGMTAITGAAQSYMHLLLARIGLGIGEAGAIPASESLLADFVPYYQRALAYSILALGSTSGIMLGVNLAGHLVDIIGWRLTFVALGVPGLLLSVLVLLTVRDPRAFAKSSPADSLCSVKFKDALKLIVRVRTYRRALGFCVLNGFINFSIQQWYPSFFHRVHHLSNSEIGFYFGTSAGLGLISGVLVGGGVVLRFHNAPPRRALDAGAIAICVSTVPLLLSVLTSSVTQAFACIFIGFGLLSFCLGAVNSVMISVIVKELRATSSAVAILLISVFGFGLGPVVVGFASDILADVAGEQSLRWALMVPISLCPVLGWSVMRIGKSLEEDLVAAK